MKKSLRVLHSPTEITGQMYLLSKELKKLGHKAVSLDIRQNKIYQRNLDINIPISGFPKVLRLLVQAVLQLWALPNFDIFHFHYGRLLLKPDILGYKVLRMLNKKIVIHFRGSDIRDTSYVVNQRLRGKKINKNKLSDEKQKKLISLTKKYADKILVSTPDLLEIVQDQKAEWLPSSIDLREWVLEPSKTKNYKGKVIIIHSPSKRWTKGTQVIIDTIKELEKEGLEIDFRLVENIPYKQLKKYYQEADIVIDQLLIGWYGVASVEAMALNKPVVCYLREDLVEKYAPDVPIFNVNPDNLKEKLSVLIKDRNLRNRIGSLGRVYVEKYHDVKKNTRRLEDIYYQLL